MIKAGNQLHLARDSLGELGAIWVEWNALHGIQTVIQFISNLKLKQKRQYDLFTVCIDVFGRKRQAKLGNVVFNLFSKFISVSKLGSISNL